MCRFQFTTAKLTLFGMPQPKAVNMVGKGWRLERWIYRDSSDK